MAIDPKGISSPAELSRALAELVVDSGLSYHDLAASAGISTATAYDAVNGRTFPRWSSLRELLGALGAADVAEWRQAHRRAGQAGRRAGAAWSGPGTAIRVADADGLRLGVHRAIAEPGVDPDSLPPYVRRDDDDSGDGVRATVAAMAAEGGFLLLVGGSSVGKTRILYEAVRDLLPDWWLLHPGSADEVRALAGAIPPGARLVVWLDELQHYLGGERGLDAATVRELLRGGILLAGTLWPVYHSDYVARPQTGEADHHSTERAVVEQARVLRLGEFSDDELRRARALGDADPRIRRALDSGDHGFTQTMAAGPQLITRWRDAGPYAAAVINAAIDSARFGVWGPLSAALLRAAAPGYCDDRARAAAPGDWFETALVYARATVHGAASPLVPVAGEGMGTVAGYRPADYLLQHAGQLRGAEIGSIELWDALAEHTSDLEDLGRLATTARILCFDRLEAVLVKRAGLQGNTDAATALLRQLSQVGHAQVADAAAWVARRTPLIDPQAVARLIASLRWPGAERYHAELTERACREMPVGDPHAVAACLRTLHDAGEHPTMAALAARAAAQTSVHDPDAVSWLWRAMTEVGATAALGELARRAAHGCELRPFGIRRLLEDITVGPVLADRVAREAPVTDPAAARHFLEPLRGTEAARTLADRIAREVSLDEPAAVATLVQFMAEAEAEALESLADRVAREAVLADRGPAFGDDGIVQLICALERGGAVDAARTLAGRAARDVPLTSASIVGGLLAATDRLACGEARAVLIARTAANTPADPWVYAWHLGALRRAGADEAARTLADRAADRMPLDRPSTVTMILAAMTDAEAESRLAQRVVRELVLGPYIQPEELVTLLDHLDEGGHTAEAFSLADRIAQEFPLDDPALVGQLVYRLAKPDFERLKPHQGVARPVRVHGRAARVLALRAARGISFEALDRFADLLGSLSAVPEAAQALVTRVVSEAPARWGLDRFLRALHKSGDTAAVRLLADRLACDEPADDAYVVQSLLGAMARAGTTDALTRLAARAAREVPIILPSAGYVPRSADRLLATLHGVGAVEAADTLADRAADLAPLDDPRGLAGLLTALDEAGHHEQARRLAHRAVRDAVLDHPDAVFDLVAALGETPLLPAMALRAARETSAEDATHIARLFYLLDSRGASAAAEILLERIARRHFGLYLSLAPPDQRERFAHGREPDGSPSAPWSWDTLP